MTALNWSNVQCTQVEVEHSKSTRVSRKKSEAWFRSEFSPMNKQQWTVVDYSGLWPTDWWIILSSWLPLFAKLSRSGRGIRQKVKPSAIYLPNSEKRMKTLVDTPQIST